MLYSSGFDPKKCPNSPLRPVAAGPLLIEQTVAVSF